MSSSDNFSINGRTAFVTAASSGIGYACAKSLSKAGAKVVICSQHKKRIADATEAIKEYTRGEVEGLVCDLRLHSQVRKTVEYLKRTYQSIDILVINHGNPKPGDYKNVKIVDWNEAINQIYFTTILLIKLLSDEMKQKKWGRIFIINSIYSKTPNRDFVISSTLRSGLLSLAKCISKDLSEYNIAVNSILPGYTNTKLLKDAAEKIAKQKGIMTSDVLDLWKNEIPSKEFVDPNTVGELVASLSQNIYNNLMGIEIPIDGNM